jgi:predicted DNA-binding protein (MmcQ/YjbR family)
VIILFCGFFHYNFYVNEPRNFYEYCLSKKGVTEHFPFDDDALVFKVGGKIFALTSLERNGIRVTGINLKCDPDRAQSCVQNMSQ